MVIYYGRDPQGRRVEVIVSKQQHKDIQAGGGWRQSGAEAQVKKQITEQYQEAVAKEQVRIEKIKEEAIEAGKTVLEKPSGEVLISTPEKVGVKRIVAAAVAAATPKITAPKIEPRPPPGPPYIREVVREFPPKPEFLEPPVMRPDIRVTPTAPFVMYEAEPKAIIGPPRVYEKPPPKDIAEAIYEFAEPLIPKRPEREIAYPSPRVGIRPILEFPLGVAYGVVTLPAAVIKMPEAVATLVTDPGKSITAMYERFVKRPGFFVGEIAGQAAITYGISKFIGWGITKIRARDITAATEVGVYEFDPVKGLGKVGVDIVVKKKGVPIELAKAQIGFKVGKELFDPSAFAAEIVAEKAGLFYALGKGVVTTKITVPSGVSTTIARATGILYKYPGFKKVLASAGISETLAAPTGLLRTVGLTVSKKGMIAYGQKFYSMLFRKPTDVFKITQIVTKPPKVVTKPTILPVVGAEIKTVADLIGKAAIKPSPVIPRTGVLTGAITAFIGKAERVKYKPIEEELYISPRARGVVGVQALDTRQRAITMQRFGLGTGQAQRTMQQLGIGRVTVPMERVGLIQPPALIQVPIQRLPPVLKPPIQKVVPKLKRPPALKKVPITTIPLIPSITPPKFPILIPELKKKVPRKRKPRVKPRYKYRVIKHPFPSIKELMGV